MSKRAGREFWSRVVAGFERSSGETHAAFAARHGVEKATFERWLYLLRNERREKAASEGVRLLPVQVTVDRNEPMVLVELGSSVTLRVGVGTDAGYVAALVRALQTC